MVPQPEDVCCDDNQVAELLSEPRGHEWCGYVRYQGEPFTQYLSINTDGEAKGNTKKLDFIAF